VSLEEGIGTQGEKPVARLCIRIAPNNNHTDPLLDALRTHEGDVVCLVDDDHVFSHAELNNGQYRILDVPGVSQAELVHLVEPVEGPRPQGHAKMMITRRKRGLNMALLNSPAFAGRTTITKTELDVLIVEKP